MSIGSGLEDLFPLDNVVIRKVKEVPQVRSPLYRGVTAVVSQEELLAAATGTGLFFVHDGSLVEYRPDIGADPAWIRLYLNNQVLVALLHQRRVLNFHASGFIYDGLGVMVLGETGAGKSSLTLSFALGGAGFMSDDLTPLAFKDGRPHLKSLHREIKLRQDTLTQLGVGDSSLREAEAGTGKKYLRVAPSETVSHSLDVIFRVETGNVERPLFSEPSPPEKFAILRGEICMSEILAGMPETEALYVSQLAAIVEQVPLVEVIRPRRIRITDLHRAVQAEIDRIRKKD